MNSSGFLALLAIILWGWGFGKSPRLTCQKQATQLCQMTTLILDMQTAIEKPIRQST